MSFVKFLKLLNLLESFSHCKESSDNRLITFRTRNQKTGQFFDYSESTREYREIFCVNSGKSAGPWMRVS